MPALDDNPDILTFSSGNQAPMLMQGTGYFLVLVGVPLTLVIPLLGVPLVLLGLRIAATLGGTELDMVNSRYREYTAYLYKLKTGKWTSLTTYPYLSVLGTNAGFSGMSRGGVETTHLERVYDVYLLNETHRSKLYVVRFESEEEAWELAERLAFELDKSTAIYSPTISAASRAMRERGRRR